MTNKNIIKIPFRNTGRKKQHGITLFSLGYIPDENERPGLGLELVDHAYNQALEYLKNKGFEEPYGNFYLENGKIIKGEKVPYYPLWGAIQERDSKKGQTGEFLAALIIAYYERLYLAINNFKSNQKTELYGYIFDQAAMIQAVFFDLFLLENIQSKFSAGNSRNNPEKDLTHFKTEAQNIFIRLRKENYTKEEYYKLIEKELAQKYPRIKTPAAQTIKGWLKSLKS